MPRKLELAAVDELRDRFAAGEPVGELAVLFTLSERHVRRLTAGIEKRPPAFSVSPDETVACAVDRYLDELRLDARGQVRAAAVRVLARRLDRADARSAPGLARGLVDVLDGLRGVREPDAVDQLRRRREARRLALSVAPWPGEESG